MALRHHDLRNLQNQLSQRGISSLGRSESCVLSSLLEVSERAHESLAVQGHEGAKREVSRIEKERSTAMSWQTAKDYLHQHTRDVLGPRPGDRHIYIMVTAPSAREADHAWMAKMLRAGMNALRINCAHEGEREWGKMIRALGAARRETDRECCVLMDFAGPKIRTGRVASARHICTWKPAKDEVGKVTASARVVIRRASAPSSGGTGPFLFVRDKAFARVCKGDELRFRDARCVREASATGDATFFVGCGGDNALRRQPKRRNRGHARALGLRDPLVAWALNVACGSGAQGGVSSSA